MADISTRLRRARERAQLQIADVSARTKIKPAFIAAIDRGDLAQLPGQFFTRAFLKAYAAEVGLDAAQIAREYDDAVGRVEPITLEELAAVVDKKFPPVPPIHQRLMAQWDAVGTIRKLSAQEWRVPSAAPSLSTPSVRLRVPRLPSMRIIRPAVAGLAMVILVVAAVASWTPGRQAEAGAVGTSGVAEAAPAPAPAPVPDTLTVEIAPTAQIWVAATADGQPAIFRMLQAGEKVTLSATKGFSFRIGNAAAFEYTINGVAGKALGAPDEVKEFDITKDNYRTFAR